MTLPLNPAGISEAVGSLGFREHAGGCLEQLVEPSHCPLEASIGFWCHRMCVICGRGEASLPGAGGLKAGLPALSPVSSDLKNLATRQDGGIWPCRASPHLARPRLPLTDSVLCL